MLKSLRRHIMMQKAGGGILPDEYQQVKYLRVNNSTSYIQTNINAADCHGSYYKLRFNSPLRYYGIHGTGWFGYHFLLWLSYNHIWLYTGVSRLRDAQIVTSGNIIEGKLYDNSSLNASGNVKIFNVSQTGADIELYNLIFYGDTESEEIANFIPCYRKSDNKAGLYDIINDYFNAGTGSFIVGPDM